MERVFLIGDSIRLGYDLYVRNKLSSKAEVYYSHENARFAYYTLRYLNEWIEQEIDPQTVTIIHFNCGLWDTGRYWEDEPFTSLDIYLNVLERIVKKLRALCPNADLIFATSTPVQSQLYDNPNFTRKNEDIEAYNNAAVQLMKKLNVSIDDLYTAASTLTVESWSDGTHLYTPTGTSTLGDCVCESIMHIIDQKNNQ